MKEIFFTAGPSQLHKNYAQYYNEALQKNLGSANHRSNTFRDVYKYTYTQLKQLLKLPNDTAIFFTGSASEIWERMIQNLVLNKSHHLVNGSFSKRFYEYAAALGINATKYEVELLKGYNEAALKVEEDVELICTTQNETSTGVKMNPTLLNKIKQINKNALLCSDLVSVAPVSEIDYTQVDSTFFSVQKAFGMPPGLGVWICNNACRQKATILQSNNKIKTAHHTLETFYKNFEKWETPSTPNIIAIYVLGRIAEEFNTYGFEKLKNETAIKKQIIYETINNSNVLKVAVENIDWQSDTMLVFKTEKSSTEIVNELKKSNLIISTGYGAIKESTIRIANFPTTSIEDINKLAFALKQLG
jgi:phosphoserine aminotransferase